MIDDSRPTLGSLFAGIGGFDLGFERAGFRTLWQVEINRHNRTVLADRFPDARQFEDVRECGAANLAKVNCLTAGFPCTDISNAGNTRKGGQRGLRGKSSGLFNEALRIITEIRPEWVVLENVPELLTINGGKDFEFVLQSLAGRGYVGCWRVLNAQYFGVPQRRRRIFLVAGLGRQPTPEYLADAAPVESIPSALSARSEPWAADAFAGGTLTASNAACRINLGCEVLVAEENGWRAMAERARGVAVHGFPMGLDAFNLAQHFSAGNAVCPQVAEWIARKILAS